MGRAYYPRVTTFEVGYRDSEGRQRPFTRARDPRRSANRVFRGAKDDGDDQHAQNARTLLLGPPRGERGEGITRRRSHSRPTST